MRKMVENTSIYIYTDRNRGKHKGEIDSDIVYQSGFSSGILEDLTSWMKDLKINMDAMVDHGASGSQMDKPF